MNSCTKNRLYSSQEIRSFESIVSVYIYMFFSWEEEPVPCVLNQHLVILDFIKSPLDLNENMKRLNEKRGSDVAVAGQ